MAPKDFFFLNLDATCVCTKDKRKNLKMLMAAPASFQVLFQE
jgi:hypothetical protein